MSLNHLSLAVIQIWFQKYVFLTVWQNPHKISVKQCCFYYLLKLNFFKGIYHGTFQDFRSSCFSRTPLTLQEQFWSLFCKPKGVLQNRCPACVNKNTSLKSTHLQSNSGLLIALMLLLNVYTKIYFLNITFFRNYVNFLEND